VWLVGAAAVCTLLGLRELYQLFEHTGYRPRPVGYICALLFLLAAALHRGTRIDLFGLVLILTVIATLGFELVHKQREGSLLAWALTFSGAIYIGWTFAHFILLRTLSAALTPAPLSVLKLDPGAAWIVFALLVNFAGDTLAYFTGRTWGQHRMAPSISPAKTWEGAAGGLLAASGAGGLLVYLLGLPISTWQGLLIGGLGSIAGQTGDLSESLIKRQVGVKDSGHLIPGHGGLLDRADSLLFTVPTIYYIVHWLTA
jgi:phosphatidate cytidylyltransferase